MHGLGEVQHFLLRPLLSGTHTQNITEEEAQLPPSPGYNRDYSTLSTFIYFLIYTVKKVSNFFPSPARMSQTKLSLGGNYKIVPRHGEFDK
jgi:hypothetical protein